MITIFRSGAWPAMGLPIGPATLTLWHSLAPGFDSARPLSGPLRLGLAGPAARSAAIMNQRLGSTGQLLKPSPTELCPSRDRLPAQGQSRGGRGGVGGGGLPQCPGPRAGGGHWRFIASACPRPASMSCLNSHSRQRALQAQVFSKRVQQTLNFHLLLTSRRAGARPARLAGAGGARLGWAGRKWGAPRPRSAPPAAGPAPPPPSGPPGTTPRASVARAKSRRGLLTRIRSESATAQPARAGRRVSWLFERVLFGVSQGRAIVSHAIAVEGRTQRSTSPVMVAPPSRRWFQDLPLRAQALSGPAAFILAVCFVVPWSRSDLLQFT